MDDNWVSAGLEVYAKMRPAEDVDALRDAASQPTAKGAMAELAVAFAFGGVWSREGLARRDRSLVTIGLLTALRQPDELRKHVQMATRNGLSVEEIQEAIVQAIPYAGFPAATSAMSVATAALAEIGLGTNAGA